MADEQIKALVRKRGSVKARLTAFTAHIDNLKVSQVNNDLDNSAILELEQRIHKLEDIYHEFTSLQSDIETLSEEDKLEEQYKIRNEFEDRYFKIAARAAQIVEENKPQNTHTPSRAGTIISNRSHHSNQSPSQRDHQVNAPRDQDNQNIQIPPNEVPQPSITHNPPLYTHSSKSVGVKLPTIKLPIFDGSYERWGPFSETYRSLIHENEDLSAIQKFHYLRSSLANEAARTIENFELYARNYEAAWNHLEKRYQDKQLAVHNHVKSIVDFPKIDRGSHGALRRLLDSLQNHLRALQALSLPVESWDSILIYVVTNKFDAETMHEWEHKRSKEKKLPTQHELFTFMERQCNLLEKIHTREQQNRTKNRVNNKTSTYVTQTDIKAQSCPICQQAHGAYSCEKLLSLTPQNRMVEVKSRRLCLNCLRPGHLLAKCKSGRCRKCNQPHNTLLHFENQTQVNATTIETESSVNADTSSTFAIVNLACESNPSRSVYNLLPTAMINIMDKYGKTHKCTALLDCCSQSSFISEDLCSKLELSTIPTNITVKGINQIESRTLSKTTTVIKSLDGRFERIIEFLTTPEVISSLPGMSLPRACFPSFENVSLADPHFYQSKSIDVLLGIDIYWDIMTFERTIHPLMHKSVFGYVISGPVPLNIRNENNNRICNLSIVDLSQQISRFWELESCLPASPKSKSDLICENHFKTTTRRESNGRFIVSMPLAKPINLLGESRNQAFNRLIALERKFIANPKLYHEYQSFLEEYIKLGHMTKLHTDTSPKGAYYIPHHGVLKETSSTTKLRVVFNASAPTTTGVSLNDLQLNGPVLQRDLLSILINFRVYNYVAMADIQMMYRQILIEPKQRALQRILWRNNPAEQPSEYELNTVTYGLTSSSFLAIRCLFEIANQIEVDNPTVARIIRNCMYVDDLLFGSDDVQEAQTLCNDIDQSLRGGGFKLRKWVSNDSNVISTVKDDNDPTSCSLQIDEEKYTRVLGLHWSPVDDTLGYIVDLPVKNEIITKRHILSMITRIFDPLGLLGPCTIIAKIMLQTMWTNKLSRDEQIPESMRIKWHEFVSSLPLLGEIRIRRQTRTNGHPTCTELHGFADASQHAYGACVYMRSYQNDLVIKTQLLCAKSKVAPLKMTTIPRLELCAALLLNRLMTKVRESIKEPIDDIIYWTDSTIVLSWLKSESRSLNTFVGNRVSEIQSNTDISKWNHVNTQDNPADVISRGLNPASIITCHIWWEGPEWLKQKKDYWPSSDIHTHQGNLPEVKSTYTCVNVSPIVEPFVIHKFSTLNRLMRVIAWCRRFINGTKKDKSNHSTGPLNLDEIQASKTSLIYVAQHESFSSEIQALNLHRELPKGSKLINLNPFLSDDNILRVGGRLERSNFDYNKKHPIILDAAHPLTTLIFRDEHERSFHTGPQSLLSIIRESYWPISGRNLAKKIVRRCIRCFRHKPITTEQIMGHLPSFRVTPSYPFHNVGVDYGGPFMVKDKRGRGSRLTKAYLCLFICMSTRAVHLELVTDLSTQAFILALRRFVSRRGIPSMIASDNGTNFVGARSELNELGSFMKSNQNGLSESFTSERIKWCFIPAYSPHFGGIWEAGIKSSKYHLKRALGQAHLTYEEFSTLLAQVEAILNSRPMTPISNEPNDMSALTPSHFLIGRTGTSIPDPDVTHIPIPRLSIYQHIQYIHQQFWRRWSLEYISELQIRKKWKKGSYTWKKDTLVLIKDDNSPPFKWALGRIIELQPVQDGAVRAVTIRTEKNIIRRATAKLCPLPIENEVAD